MPLDVEALGAPNRCTVDATRSVSGRRGWYCFEVERETWCLHFGLSQAVFVSTAVKAPSATWEFGYRRTVLLTDLIFIAVSVWVGLVLIYGSLTGHLPGTLAVRTATVLLRSLFV